MELHNIYTKHTRNRFYSILHAYTIYNLYIIDFLGVQIHVFMVDVTQKYYTCYYVDDILGYVNNRCFLSLWTKREKFSMMVSQVE